MEIFLACVNDIGQCHDRLWLSIDAAAFDDLGAARNFCDALHSL